MVRFQFGQFVVEAGAGLYVRVPYLGAVFVGRGLSAVTNWRTLKALGEVR